MAPDILKPLEPIFYHNRPAILEGDVFSVLRQSPYVVRSFEFGLADGAVDCSQSYDTASSFADRFWELDHSMRDPVTPHDILLFDIKGSVFDQRLMSNVAQGKNIAFYIGVSMTDSSFVELIPNYNQDPSDEANPLVSLEIDQRKYLSINTDRDSKLALRTQGLNQTNAPFRMPRYMLRDAILRVRDCARSQGQEAYVNPWTQVAFQEWVPRMTTSSRFIKPLESTANFTAYEATMDLYRIIQSQQKTTGMLLDFVGLQPRVADFKLVELSQPPRQVFVQHKLHTKLLSSKNPFSSVNVVARRTAKNPQWYFSATNRFDFFFFQFMISDDPGHRTEFFFLPERVIPDSFFISTDTEQSFDRKDFLRFKIHMDDDHKWVFRLQEIIGQEIQPRKPGQRPLRRLAPIAGVDFELEAEAGMSAEPEMESDSEMHKAGEDDKHNPSVLDTTELQEIEGDWIDPTQPRALDVKALKQSHVRFFEEVMQQCAMRLEGLLVVLSSDHPCGDFAFCRYKWTDVERETYLTHGRTPRAAHHLHAIAPMVPIYLYSRHAGCSFEGPNLKPAVFRRLNACAVPSIMAWDLVGPDSLQSTPPILIPSEDMGITERQYQVFAKESEVKFGDHIGYTPSLSALLNSGRFAAEYSVAKVGPLVYGHNVWGEVWRVLNAFAGVDEFEHPAGMKRQPSVYRQPLRALHQQLAQEFHHLSSTATRR
ncbi:hypothetical protein KCU95_g3200, partial [Aureobasidium melanogenum]